MPWGRIIKALSGFYYVLPDQMEYDENALIQCRARGIFRKKGLSPLVGDRVLFETTSNREGTIVEVEERSNQLVRPPIANVDLAVLVFSLDEPEFCSLLLDRFLVQTEKEGIPAIICLTKADLVSDSSLIEQITNDYREIGYPVFVTSAKKNSGIEELKASLKGKLAVLAGQSGVGKSSLLNALVPTFNLKTSEISYRLGRGKHTTRHVELLPLGNEGLVADTPGFSQLEFHNILPEELSDYFLEMRARKNQCRFRGCLHDQEPGCAIQLALSERQICDYRYEHYLQFLQEIREIRQRRY